jgi:hypothetical protein
MDDDFKKKIIEWEVGNILALPYSWVAILASARHNKFHVTDFFPEAAPAAGWAVHKTDLLDFAGVGAIAAKVREHIGEKVLSSGKERGEKKIVPLAGREAVLLRRPRQSSNAFVHERFYSLELGLLNGERCWQLGDNRLLVSLDFRRFKGKSPMIMPAIVRDEKAAPVRLRKTVKIGTQVAPAFEPAN